MSRSLKKGPFCSIKLLKKVNIINYSNLKNKFIKTWSRNSIILPTFVGFTFLVYNGKKHIPVFVNENMIGHKLGEFSYTRNFNGHSKK